MSGGGRRDGEWNSGDKERFERYENRGQKMPYLDTQSPAPPRRSFSTARGYVVSVSDGHRLLHRDSRGFGGGVNSMRRQDYAENRGTSPTRSQSPHRARDDAPRSIRRISTSVPGRGGFRIENEPMREYVEGAPYRRRSGPARDDYRPPYQRHHDRAMKDSRFMSYEEDDYSRGGFRVGRDMMGRRLYNSNEEDKRNRAPDRRLNGLDDSGHGSSYYSKRNWDTSPQIKVEGTRPGEQKKVIITTQKGSVQIDVGNGSTMISKRPELDPHKAVRSPPGSGFKRISDRLGGELKTVGRDVELTKKFNASSHSTPVISKDSTEFGSNTNTGSKFSALNSQEVPVRKRPRTEIDLAHVVHPKRTELTTASVDHAEAAFGRSRSEVVVASSSPSAGSAAPGSVAVDSSSSKKLDARDSASPYLPSTKIKDPVDAAVIPEKSSSDCTQNSKDVKELERSSTSNVGKPVQPSVSRKESSPIDATDTGQARDVPQMVTADQVSLTTSKLKDPTVLTGTDRIQETQNDRASTAMETKTPPSEASSEDEDMDMSPEEPEAEAEHVQGEGLAGGVDPIVERGPKAELEHSSTEEVANHNSRPGPDQTVTLEAGPKENEEETKSSPSVQNVFKLGAVPGPATFVKPDAPEPRFESVERGGAAPAQQDEACESGKGYLVLEEEVELTKGGLATARLVDSERTGGKRETRPSSGRDAARDRQPSEPAEKDTPVLLTKALINEGTSARMKVSGRAPLASPVAVSSWGRSSALVSEENHRRRARTHELEIESDATDKNGRIIHEDQQSFIGGVQKWESTRPSTGESGICSTANDSDREKKAQKAEQMDIENADSESIALPTKRSKPDEDSSGKQQKEAKLPRPVADVAPAEMSRSDLAGSSKVQVEVGLAKPDLSPKTQEVRSDPYRDPGAIPASDERGAVWNNAEATSNQVLLSKNIRQTSVTEEGGSFPDRQSKDEVLAEINRVEKKLSTIRKSITSLKQDVPQRKAEPKAGSTPPQPARDAEVLVSERRVPAEPLAATIGSEAAEVKHVEGKRKLQSALEKRPSSLERVTASKEELPKLGKSVKRKLSRLEEMAREITQDGQSLAESAQNSLNRLCGKGQLVADSWISLKEPGELEDVRRVANDALHRPQKLREGIIAEKKHRRERTKKLHAKYRMLEKQWKSDLRNMRDKRSRDKRELSRDRDRYLMMAIRGTDMIPTSRTGSGRVTYKPSGEGGAPGAPSSLQQVDVMLTQVESAGGTPGGRDRWRRTLATVPDQNPDHPPFEGGSVLIEDPLAEFYARRVENPWTREERICFLNNYLEYNKDFRKIAQFLENKCTEDVVRFYFQNKLCLNLKQLTKENIRRRGNGSRRTPRLTRFGPEIGRREPR
uniref:SANT domain-containing protein n=1 Tax=Rhodosorus marinus TaxID=101924 RepID=A0A7S3A5L6_9RHOD|mmetsp:Transcript_45657/g.177696  ORF Transcript_45657/g.177696 Transcript_45657/m.177696 type:complete len:1376 (+) Transcript_45657:99-4226(+)